MGGLQELRSQIQGKLNERHGEGWVRKANEFGLFRDE